MPSATFISAEAIGLLEIDGLPRALRAQDAALKRAPVKILACAPVSPNKVVLLMTGDVASVEESLAAAEDGLGSRRIDRLFLPGVHPAVIAAVRGDRLVPNADPLGIFELATVATTISAADLAVKATEVRIERMHLATGFGGRGFFTLRGAQADIEEASRFLGASLGEALLDAEVIAAPHAELLEGAFRRPWNLDPADRG
ncbi:MAG: BMC domain-containing protein [Myxococcota bacterium]|nr:BMC domain-containing protein [Myxococcota bacterium]